MGWRFLDLWPLWNPARARQSRLGFNLMIGLIDIGFIGTLYGVTNQVMGQRAVTVWDPATALDLTIPFVAISILAYHSLYVLFYPLPLYLMPDTDAGRRDLMVLSQGMFTLAIVSCAFFVLLPAEVYIRSAAVAGLADAPAWLHPFYEATWAVDQPFNAWPSLHVSQAGLLTWFGCRWLAGRQPLQIALVAACAVMCVSILTTKQHFLWDLFTGFVLLGAVLRWQMLPTLARIEGGDASEGVVCDADD